MKKILFSVFIIAFLVTGCDEKENNMPEEMPSDFDFLIQFGVQSKNEINTFDNIVIKDLIAEGTASTEMFYRRRNKNNLSKDARDKYNEV